MNNGTSAINALSFLTPKEAKVHIIQYVCFNFERESLNIGCMVYQIVIPMLEINPIPHGMMLPNG